MPTHAAIITGHTEFIADMKTAIESVVDGVMVKKSAAQDALAIAIDTVGHVMVLAAVV